MKQTDMLKKNYEFKQVLQCGKHYSDKNLSVFIMENKKKDKNYLGLAISSKLRKFRTEKQIKKAFKRNI